MTLGTLPGEALELLRSWLPSNDDPVRPLMTLATVTPGGYPDARAVLLTEVDDQGFYFHTDTGSTKMAQLAAESHVALTLLWPRLPRQLVVRGIAFMAPPDESRRGVGASFAAVHPEGVAIPDTWCAVVVRPTELTFWFDGDDTASRRVRFTRRDDGGDWMRRILPG